MSCPREEREALEQLLVGPYGVRAAASKGRLHPEEECAVRLKEQSAGSVKLCRTGESFRPVRVR